MTIFKPLRNALLIAIATLFVLEIALRIIGMANPVIYISDSTCGYRHQPNQHIRFLGSEIVINRLGVRDLRNFESTPTGTTRILVLGDSVTWGGVTMRNEQLFTSLLEHGLPKTEVINAGVNGYSVHQMVSLYESHLKELQPDVIVVYCITGDFLRPPITDLSGNSTAFPTHEPWFAISRSVAIARLQIAAKTGVAWLRPLNGTLSRDGERTPEERIAANTRALVHLKEMMTPQQHLVIVMSPQIQNSVSTVTVGRIMKLLREQKFDVIDLQNGITPQPDWFFDGTHLSAEGHAWVASRLKETSITRTK